MDFPTRAAQLRRTGVQTLSRGRSLARKSLDVVKDRLTERNVAQRFAPAAHDSFTAALYFAGDGASVYQLSEWLWSCEQLAARLTAKGFGEAPVVVFCRHAGHAEQISRLTTLPVRFGRLARDLDTFMTLPSLRIVFYVNQSPLNFQALRYPQPAHVHLSHGESEKISMISNQLKAYDYVFTAGAAARERILAALPDYAAHGGQQRMRDVGRPQLDAPRQMPQAWQEMQTDDRLTVFYAPTWEGDSPSMAYGTIHLNGPATVQRLLDEGCRVIVRPHPRTGYLDLAAAQALAELRRITEDHPRGYFDDDPRIGWQLDAADVCLTEMSALAFDWLSTGKPLVLIKPGTVEAEVMPGGLFDRVPHTGPRDPAAISAAVITAAHASADPRLADAQLHYLGDTSPGAQKRRFEDAVLQVIASRAS